MRRGYTREAYLELIDRVRELLPEASISSDFISGFCGEDERDLMALLRASFGGGVRQVKPKASRGESREIYVVGREYLPEAAAEALRNG